MGNKHLTTRFVRNPDLLAGYPGRAISADPRNAAGVDEYYRLTDQADTPGEELTHLLAAHRERTLQRMGGQPTALVFHEGIDLTFVTRKGIDGLEVTDRKQPGTGTLGLHMQLTLAVTAAGLPLGVLRCTFDTQPTSRRRRSRRWIDSFQDITAAVRELPPSTQAIAVMDREVDFFGLFDAQRRNSRVDLLVRVQRDNDPEGTGRKLFASLVEQPAAGYVEVEVTGPRAGPKASGPRIAACELRFGQVTLPGTRKDAVPVALSGVHLVEREPPTDREAVQWCLLTTLTVPDTAAATEVAGFHMLHWCVEDYMRMFKSGCREEHLPYTSVNWLQRALSTNSVVAWRLLVMSLLGRQFPESAPELLFGDDELAFLRDYASYYGLSDPSQLRAATRLVAQLGGGRVRLVDPEPTNKLMWNGCNSLVAATYGHRLAGESSRQRRPAE